MAMTRGTALVDTVAKVVQLTGVQNLANLETSGELTLTDLLTTASDAIYDRLEAEGLDPSNLTNETRYERAVAWEFLAILYGNGFLAPGPGENAQQAWERARAHVDRYYEQVRPRLSEGDEPGRATEGLPLTLNFEPGHTFGPNPAAQTETERFWDDLPDSR